MKTKDLILTASLLGMGATNAATISWSGTTFLVSGTGGRDLVTGQFNQTGTFVSAQNLGGAALTFDGISFAAGPAGTGNSFNFSGSNFHAADGNTDLARFVAYRGNASLATVNLTGLTIGNTYRIQALVYDGRAIVNGRTASFDGNNLGTFANGTADEWGNGLLATGTFVADASTQDFTIGVFNSAGTTLVSSQLSALTLYQTAAIPEPSAALLGGLSMLALLRRRR